MLTSWCKKPVVCVLVCLTGSWWTVLYAENSAEPVSTPKDQLQELSAELQEVEGKLEEGKQGSRVQLNQARALQKRLQARYEEAGKDEKLKKLQVHIALLEQELATAREQLSDTLNADEVYLSLLDKQKVFSRELGELRNQQRNLGLQRSSLIGKIAAIKVQLQRKEKSQTATLDLQSNEASEDNTP
jgi:hypothetical protein